MTRRRTRDEFDIPGELMDHTESRPAVPAQTPPTQPPEPSTARTEPETTSGARPFCGVTRAHLNVTELHAALTKAVRHGARSARIAHHVPQLVDILYPDGALTAPYLAAVVNTIRAALDSIGGTDAAALDQLLGLAPAALGRPLRERRAAAARALGIESDTFRRTHQRALLWDLTMEIYQAHPE